MKNSILTIRPTGRAKSTSTSGLLLTIPPLSHPQTLAWVTAGGRVGGVQADAMNKLFQSLDQDGVTYGASGKIKRLNLFVGQSLSDCLRPQVVASGAATDTNVNFVEADYSSMGLTGNFGKRLMTGTNFSFFNASGATIGAYLRTLPQTAGEIRGTIGAPTQAQIIESINANGNKQSQVVNGNFFSVANTAVGLFAGTFPGQSGGSQVILQNGVSIGSGAANAITWNNTEIQVFDVGYSSSWANYGAYFIAEALTPTEHLKFYNRLQEFMTRLERNV